MQQSSFPFSALIVDDVAAVRSYLRQILQQMGITNILEAQDGQSANALFLDNLPDVVFLDIHLPDINGQQLLKIFKSYRKPTAVFMISAFSSVENLQQALQNGASAFVIKPFSAHRICTLVQPLLP